MTARYKAERRIARGDVAEVLLATDTQSGARVVVKRLLPDLAADDALVALFEREIAIARTLEHPNIVRVLDVGRAGRVPFYVMEHLDGIDLRQAALGSRKRGTRMPPAVACIVGAAVASGLSYAHERGAIHRDVKPANVFVTRGGELRVLDFGIAKSAEHVALTRTGVARGTAAYMAPEQLAGLAVDARADVFALGVVLWEALTSRRLFKRDTVEEIARAVRHDPAPPPSAYVNGVPPRVEALVMGMLGKLASTRPPARVVADVLAAEAQALGETDARRALAAFVAGV